MTARCAVVTPYYKESRDILQRCIDSVLKQTIPVDHIVVADGFPQDWIDGMPVRHIKLDRAHRNFGNTPRSVGLMVAVGSEYDGITMLDADNWLDPNHCEYCLGVAEPKGQPPFDLVIARRRFVRPDRSVLPIPEEPISALVDTNCYFHLKGSFHILPIWGMMPNPLAVICDRVVWQSTKQQPMRAIRTEEPTVNYVTLHAAHYMMAGETPPPGASRELDFEPLMDWIRSLSQADITRIARRIGFRVDEIRYEKRK